MPRSSASLAESTRLVSVSSSARFSPTMRGRNQLDDPSGVRPTPVYAITNFADSPAITRSDAHTRPRPAPAALPWTAATTGAFPRTSIPIAVCNDGRSVRTRSVSPSPAAANDLRSPPPQNREPVPESSTARTDASASISMTAARRSRATSSLMPLASSGRCRVRCATFSRTSRRTVSKFMGADATDACPPTGRGAVGQRAGRESRPTERQRSRARPNRPGPLKKGLHLLEL